MRSILSDRPFYREEQRMTGRYFPLLVALLMFFGPVIVLAAYRAWNRENLLGLLTAWLVGGYLVLYSRGMTLVCTVDREGVMVRLFFIHWRYLHRNIVGVAVLQKRTQREYITWIFSQLRRRHRPRAGAGGGARILQALGFNAGRRDQYLAIANTGGVTLRLTDGRTVTIGSQQPEALAEAIRSALGPR